MLHSSVKSPVHKQGKDGRAGCGQAGIKCLCDLNGHQRDNKTGGDETDNDIAVIEGKELLKDRIALDDSGVNKSPG